MTESEKSFEAYMSEEITYAGVTGKRSVIWSIPRCVLAREVWMDCMERQNVARSSKRDKQHSPSGT
ncbi:hypothetical protein [Erwinia sorbitola]|uniref:Uncharacterized protein n=1 Tax=Erwinia sorbitola TaxID=2681984 RepID=A0A6I6EZG2_9GAMM|nr:hypothetical protein [Erwinia sorbitola]QGU87040.1 hypothetical protein GN242_07335 [Erwinia sorbitola]